MEKESCPCGENCACTPDNHCGCKNVSLPTIGEEAPAFHAVSTQGEINFPGDYEGRWVVLFSHPADFTPVCTSELASFAALGNEFAKLNTALLGVSVDAVSSHLAWMKDIEENIRFHDYQGQKITYPVVADVKMEVARKYGMMQHKASDTKAVRAVFFIDPKHIIRAIIYYPLSNGRNFDEILRILQAMQTSDKYGVATPADWQPGDAVLQPAPATAAAMKEQLEAMNAPGKTCQTWYFCQKKL